MKDEHEEIQQEESRRYWRETWKQRLIIIRQIAYTLIALIVTVLLCMGLWSWKQANNLAAKTNTNLNESIAGLNEFIKKANEKLDQVEPQKVNDLLVSVKERVDGLKQIEDNTARAVSTLEYHTGLVMQGVEARLGTLDTVLTEGRSLIARTNQSVNGDTDKRAVIRSILTGRPNGLVPVITGTVSSLNTFIKDTDTHVSKVLSDGSQLLETINPRVATILDHADAVVVDLDGTIKEYKPIGVNLTAATGDLARITKDSADKYHSLLFPPAVHGFFPRLKQVGQYVLKLAFDGVRFYYQVKTLNELPVRITQPIPLAH